MTRDCPSCQRPNAAHKSACMYCGNELPDPVGVPETEPDLPSDIDQLVRQAMTLGTTINLSRALKAHRDEKGQKPDGNEAGSSDCERMDRADILGRLGQAVADAVTADAAADESAVWTALQAVRSLLDQCPVVAPDTQSQDVKTVPTVMLPKVRRDFSLVIDGMGDVDRHPELVEALGIDAVTARMLAIARQPRVAIRSDDRSRLDTLASMLNDELGIPAAVFSREDLIDVGPARLLSSFSNGVESLVIGDWLGDLHASLKNGSFEPVSEPPVLIVPGELVIMRYRTARGGGRLKHLRDGKLEPASEQRLAVVDLHLESGILRILEGVSDLSGAPGAIADGFRRTLRVLTDQWAEQGIQMLEQRTCSPAMDSTHTRIEEHGGRVASGWPEWEEHSRAARWLFTNAE